MRIRRLCMTGLAVLALTLVAPHGVVAQQQRPHIVFMLVDNAPTPRLDQLAAEGLRLTNFNVEPECTPTRSALLTGRMSMRSGTSKVPLPGLPQGLTPWEYTLAELLHDAGYQTAMYGKWHLGDKPGRYPTDQGFDAWWGIANSTDESWWAHNDRMPPEIKAQMHPSVIQQSTKGSMPTEVKPYDLPQRARMDGELTAKAVS